MGFDGIPRPAQLTPYTDAMNPYAAANAARTDRAAKPLIQGLGKDEKIKGLEKEDRDQPRDEDEEKGETFTEEEAEQIVLFARMRGVMNLVLESGVKYEFQMNANGLVDLVEMHTGRVVLQLLPEELIRMSEKMHRYAGMLTDRAG